MTTRLSLGFALLLAACAPGTDVPDAKFWTVSHFIKARDKNPDFGGYFPKDLVVPQGEPLVFLSGTQNEGQGLTLFPAVAEGKAASFVITEIWANWPDPWVQPVYLPRDEAGRPMQDARTVFPVDVVSTFYSPFWRAEELLTPDLDEDTYRSARDVLNAPPGTQRRSGAIVFCPIVPPETRFANDGTGTKDPMTRTLATLKPTPPVVHPGWLPPATSDAWVDGKPVSYFDFGADHAPSDGQVVFDAPAYFFVKAQGGAPLPVAAVLPDEPVRHAFVTRHDVTLPPGALPFIPPNRPELRALLASKGLEVPALSDPSLDAFPQYTLRVAVDPACFADARFPASCDWLDSPARVLRLPSNTVVERRVQLGIGVVLP